VSKTFEKFVTGLRENAENDLEKAFSQENAKWAKEEALANSRRWICIQEIIFEKVVLFGKKLENRLIKYDPAFTPITKEDFILAISAIQPFSMHCRAFYNTKHVSNAPFRGSPIPFDNEKMKALVENAINDLEEQKKFFLSKRSFCKRAWGYIIENLWIIIVAWVVGLIVLFAKRLWNFALFSFS
jgi:hypothetical protein